jgi:hypothetical protein
MPKETVDRNPLSVPPAVEIYRGIQSASGAAQSIPSNAPALLVTIPSAMQGSYMIGDHFRYVDSLTAGDFLPNHQQTFTSYIVRTRSSPKKDSSDSNRAELTIYPAPQAISDLRTEVGQSGVTLTWTAPQATLIGEPPQIIGYHVYRADEQLPAPAAAAGASPAPSSSERTQLASPLIQIAETTSPGYQDAATQRNKSYLYSVRSTVQIPGKLLEAADSNLASASVRDIYPPSMPTDLIATPVPAEAGTAAHLDLSWAINPETDLTGYNVYRSEQAGAPGTRLNAQPLPTPAFRDMNAVPGHTYFYTVTAVDRTGNESAASAAVQSALPAESQASP